MRKAVPAFLEGKEYKASDGATSRSEGHAAGLAARPGVHRKQEAAVNSGQKINKSVGKSKGFSYGKAGK